MRADRDSELRDSTDKVETELHKTVCGLEELTATKPPDGDEKQQLQYYHKLEGGFPASVSIIRWCVLLFIMKLEIFVKIYVVHFLKFSITSIIR